MSKLSLMILKESLEKKIGILDEILQITEKQKTVLEMPSVDYEAFDKFANEKEPLIEQLNKLDEGFEILYEKVKKDLETHKDECVDCIAQMKQLIKAVMEKSTSIQALEARNKQTIEAVFRKERQACSQGKKSMQVALGYYRNMNNSQIVPPQFMDQKK